MSDSKPKLKSTWPQLIVTDIGKTLAYYQDCLGFESQWQWGDPPMYACAKRDDVSIHFVLAPVSGIPNAEFRTNATDIYVEVECADALFEELKRRGANVTLDIDTRDYGMRDFAVMDGNGYRISFGEVAED